MYMFAHRHTHTRTLRLRVCKQYLLWGLNMLIMPTLAIWSPKAITTLRRRKYTHRSQINIQAYVLWPHVVLYSTESQARDTSDCEKGP